ncbi:disulfide isomerase-like 2-1 protein [Nymphaea thermarum]|nr:disulfide isomerase-like 2-1 protein [Nymphaea thermarum]
MTLPFPDSYAYFILTVARLLHSRSCSGRCRGEGAKGRRLASHNTLVFPELLGAHPDGGSGSGRRRRRPERGQFRVGGRQRKRRACGVLRPLVDRNEHKSICSKCGFAGYPTIKWFPHGPEMKLD